MCTAVSVWGKRHLVGRTLDVAHTYGEEVVLTPREAALPCVAGAHYAMLGVAHLFWGMPLYYDAVNEYGLVGVALRFPEETVYQKAGAGKVGIPSYALLSTVLANAKTVAEADAFLTNVVVTGDAVDAALPVTPLHWMFADSKRALTVESTRDGLMRYDNPVGVLTNAPAFPLQLAGMERGEVAGEFSSTARFCRCALYKTRTVVGNFAEEAAADVFHLMETVSVPQGAVCTATGEMPCTQYTVCVDADTRTYYYTTRGCRRIRAVTMRGQNVAGKALAVFPLMRAEDVLYL